MCALIAVEPVEYSERKIKRYYGYKIANLNAERLQEVINGVNVAQHPRIWQEEDMVCYQYPNKPLIIVKDGKLFTTLQMWNGMEFPHREIRHQASILLRILGKAELASYNRQTIARPKFTPKRWR
jgi:hypothetical protein